MSVSATHSKATPTSESASRNGAVPPLENGDRLSREEFERRFDAMPNLKKAELIEGVVYVPSPVRQRNHGRPQYHLLAWLGQYDAGTPGLEGGDNSSVRLDLGSMPQPDCVLFIRPEHGGQVRIDADDYLSGAPDLIAEVAPSSASYDLHDKLRAYERNGVREYVVWRVFDRRVDWFVLREERYEPLVPAPDGTLRSIVFPGLWLDTAALLSGDLSAVLATVGRGLNSPEHAEFIAQLERARTEQKS